MPLRECECPTCRGVGHVDRLEELAGDAWKPTRYRRGSIELAAAWQALGDGIAWLRTNDIPCPECSGTGTVTLEFFGCKIF